MKVENASTGSQQELIDSPESGEHPADSLLVDPESEVSPTLSVVMPTLNEEEGIGECITRIKNALVELQITGEIIISDSSDDRTPEIAESLKARVLHPDRPGYGYAYRYAFERARGDYICMGDADTTYDFEELPKLFQPIQDDEADIVMGSRLAGEIKDGAMPSLHRYVGNPLLTAFLNTFYDTGVTDAHSGFRVFRRDVLDELDLQSDGMEFASEMVMAAGAEDVRTVEVPITYHEREGEATLESFSDGWRHVKFMLVNAPGYLFSIPGAVLGGLGVTLMLLAYLNISLADQPFGIHSLIAGSLLTLLGYQVGSFGLLTSIIANPIQRAEDILTVQVRNYFTLERGVALGMILFAVGSITAVLLLIRWIRSGFTELPLVSADIFAFTLIVLGMQTIFGSFFASILADVKS